MSAIPVSKLSKTVDIELKSYGTPAELVEHEAGAMYLALEDKSALEVGYLFGLDRFYSKNNSIRSCVSKAINLVLDNPKRYALSPEQVGFIQGKLAARNKNQISDETLREQEEARSLDITKQITETRDLAAKLVRKKLEYLESHPKALKEEKLKDLAWVTGILFDKGQIASGNATEHIAVLSKIDSNLSPQETMNAIINLREQIVADKAKQT